MRHLGLCILIAGLVGLSVPARADYGWIPAYKQLITRAGFSVLKSSGNFNTDGGLDPLPSNAELTDNIFLFSGEYGIADGWSLSLEAPILVSSLDTGAEASGLGDIVTRLKWAVKPVVPIFTLEAMLKFPSGNASAASAQELVLGEGNFDFGLYVHSGHRGGRFLFSLSPGFLLRFGGYAPALAGDVVVQYNFPRGFIRAVGSVIYSLQDNFLSDSSFTQHDAPGTGGSLTRLNGSPIGFDAGGRIGIKITDQVALEAHFTKALFGSRYPDYWRAGGTLKVVFDFYESPKSIKAKDVPFDFDYEKY